MELAIRQIILMILILVVGIFLIIFIVSKIGSEGSITTSTFELINDTKDMLQ